MFRPTSSFFVVVGLCYLFLLSAMVVVVHGWSSTFPRSLSSSSLVAARRKSTSTTSTTRFSFALQAAEKDGNDSGQVDNNDDNDNDANDGDTRLERVSISGVSVSKLGFHALLDTSRGTLPLKITNTVQDAYAATSPESLTLIQLLSGVDMAGAILPPETLSKMAVLYCELVPELFASPSQRAVVEYVQESLPKETACFAEAHPWVQSRVKLPQVTLDQLELIYNNNSNENENDKWNCRFQCAMKGDDKWSDSMTMDVTPEIVMPVSYQYEPETSCMFTCLCLALRYKAPIVIRNLSNVPIPNNLDDDFPQRTTVQNLQSTSTRVAQNIERGFEVHTLTKALQIAMEKGDQGAVERIRAKLDEYDSMDDLPTTTTSKGKNGKESDDDDDDDDDDDESNDLDDLDANILQ